MILKSNLKHLTTLLPLLFLAACATQKDRIDSYSQVIQTTTNSATSSTAITYPNHLAHPQQAELKTLIALQNHLYNVAAPLLVNNTELCRNNSRHLLGFTAKTRYSYSSELIPAATAMGLTDQLTVTDVLTGSGAERAGIKQNDLLTTIQGQPAPQGEDAEKQAAIMLVPLINSNKTIQLGLIRKGQPLNFNVPLTNACAFGIELGNTNNVNSYADGRRVLITAGMMKFVQNDPELAMVIAREIAHNTLAHPAKQRMTATLGGIIDNLIRMRPDTASLADNVSIRPYTQQFDVEADRLALYMLARAGYRIDHATAFWQRLATQYPASIPNGHTAIHPSIAARLSAIQNTIAEISAKQTSGMALLP